MVYPPRVINEPIVRISRTPSMVALLVGKPRPNNMFNSKYIPIVNSGIPIIKETNDSFSATIFPPCTPDSLRYLSDSMTVLSPDAFFFILSISPELQSKN